MLGIWGDEKTGKPVGADIKKKKNLSQFFTQLITLRVQIKKKSKIYLLKKEIFTIRKLKLS